MQDARAIVLGVDQGTTNTKVMAVDAAGRVLAEAARPIATSAPQPGWVEQDPGAMFDNVVACIAEVLDKAGRVAGGVAGLGIANQTETLVVWDRRTGRASMPAIVWQCRRGTAELSMLDARAAELVERRTGLGLDPTFTAAKLMWVFANRPEIAAGIRAGNMLFGTVDTWLMWKLSGGKVYATEPGNASRTMLFDIDELRWHEELLDLFGLASAILPECRRSAGRFGTTEAGLFGPPIAITAALGDQQASLFGHGCFAEPQTKVTYGTGAFLWANAGRAVGRKAGHGLIRTIAWQLDETHYALEGFIMSAGATLEWIGRRLAITGGSAGVVREAEALGTSAGVILVPAFQGLASPWWQPDVRAAILGLSEATERGHIAHASAEAVCYQVRAALDGLRKVTGSTPDAIRVDGGPVRSPYLMQLQSDILQIPLIPASVNSTTPYGAALIAGLGAGLWSSLDDVAAVIRSSDPVLPRMEQAPAWEAGYRIWREAVEATIANRKRFGPEA